MKYFKHLDFPSKNIGFLYKGRSNNKLVLGGIMNTLLGILCLILFYIFSDNMLNRLNPNLYSSQNYDGDTRVINFDDSGNNIALQISNIYTEDNKLQMDFSLFTIGAYLSTYESFINGTRLQYKQRLKLKLCNISDFDDEFIEVFKKNKLNETAFCLENKNFEIYGQYTSRIFRYLNFRVEECDGKDLLTGAKIKCKNSTLRDQQISEYKISVYMTYSLPNFKNYENPLINQVLNVAYSLSPNSFNKDNYFFSSDVFYSDDDLFLPQPETRLSFHNFTSYSGSQPTVSAKEKFRNNVFLSIYYRVDPFFNYYKRSYKKIPDIIAQIYPFMKLGSFFISIFISFFRKKILLTKIINSYFHTMTNKDVELINSLKEEFPSISSLDYYDDKPYSINSSSREISLQNISDNLDERQKQKFILKKKSYDKKLLKSKFTYFCLCFNRKEEKIINQLSKRLKDKLELKNYISLVSEVEKMICILFNEDTKNVFCAWGENYMIDENFKVYSDWLNNIKYPSNSEVIFSLKNLTNDPKNEIEKNLLSYFSQYINSSK
jgi:hypothetical protein